MQFSGQLLKGYGDRFLAKLNQYRTMFDFVLLCARSTNWRVYLNLHACIQRACSTSSKKSCFSSGVLVSSAKALLIAACFNSTLTASRLWPRVLKFVAARDKCYEQKSETETSKVLKAFS